MSYTVAYGMLADWPFSCFVPIVVVIIGIITHAICVGVVLRSTIPRRLIKKLVGDNNRAWTWGTY